MLLTTNSMLDVRVRGARPQEATMAEREYTFALLVAGLDVDDDADCDAFFSAGLDDSVLEDRDGMALATFFRTADSARSALTSAITAIERDVPGATVLRIDDLECISCHHKECPTDHECMKKITPEMVLSAARELLAKQEGA